MNGCVRIRRGGKGMAGKWEMQVQNVNKRAPEGMLIYIYTYKPTLFVMEIKLRTYSLPPLYYLHQPSLTIAYYI